MKRLYPRRIHDKFLLSHLLEHYLHTISQPPLNVYLQALAYDSQIPESVFRRLTNLTKDPEDAPNLKAEDYHIVFSNIMFRYPTVKMWAASDGTVFFER